MRVFSCLLVLCLFFSESFAGRKFATIVEPFPLDSFVLFPLRSSEEETERLNALLNPLGMRFEDKIITHRDLNGELVEFIFPRVMIESDLLYGEAFQLLQSLKGEYRSLTPGFPENSDEDVFFSSGPIIHSARTYVGENEKVAILGFNIPSGPPRRFAVRARGSSSNLGVENLIENPVVSLYHASGELIIANDNGGELAEWEKGAALVLYYNDPQYRKLLQDFSEGEPSSGKIEEFISLRSQLFERDVVITTILDPGNYGIIVSGKDGEQGVALVEYFIDSTFTLQINEFEREVVVP